MTTGMSAPPIGITERIPSKRPIHIMIENAITLSGFTKNDTFNNHYPKKLILNYFELSKLLLYVSCN